MYVILLRPYIQLGIWKNPKLTCEQHCVAPLAHLVDGLAGVVAQLGLARSREDEAVVGALLLHLAAARRRKLSLAKVPNHLRVSRSDERSIKSEKAGNL